MSEREDASQLATLREALADREVRIAELLARLTDREREIAQLRETLERAEATNLEATRDLRLRLAQAHGTPSSARSAREERSMAALRQLGRSVLRDSRVVALKRAFESVPPLRKQRLRALGARIESSGLFDRDYYLKSNPDVRDTGIDPARHYLVQGWKELRDPSPAFSTAKYLLDYRDIAARGINPLAHYLEHGHSEGRLIFPSSATRRARSALSAIAALPGESALGRPDAAIAEEVRVIRESGRFDESFYRALYVDIEPPTADPVRHYCETGWREGRNPSNDFDTRFYLETYSDIRDSGMNPFYHYVLAGAAEQRRARPDFATRYEDDIWFGDAASEVKLLAFHVVPDWPVLRNARAGLKGFTQPPFPHEEVGFYDPADPAVLARQAAAARRHGIHGFCFDLADSGCADEAVRVLRSLLAHAEISLPFCVQWPLGQDTIDRPPLDLLAHAVRDPRYVRGGTRPLVVLATASNDGNAQADVASLRERLAATAGGDAFFVARPATAGETALAAACDAVLDLPVAADRTEPGDFRPQDRNGVDVVPYGIVAAQGIARSKRSQSASRATYHVVSLGRCQPGTDGMRPLVHSHFDTRDYRRWLDVAIASARAAHGEDRRFVFLNAWNAWHEGLALEPDRQGGYTRLNETTRALLGIASGAYMPKVSVIVPNYNHEGFLRRRLESIYGQTYKNIEVILLDDASTDASRTVLDRYAAAHPHITGRLYNDRNSGGVFRQWAKGIRAATGDLVWIAESDDYCDEGFLEVLTRFFADEAVLLAYARSAFVDRDGFPIRDDFEQYLADLPDPGRWHEPYVATAHDEVRTGLGIKNTIPNASGVVFRRPPDMPLLDDPAWLGMSVAGDWVFYLHVLRGGKIAYTTATTNYFRRYSGSTAESSYRKEAYFREGGLASRTVASLYDVPLEVLEHCRRNYESAYEALVGGDSDRFWDWYDYASVLRARSRRVPNIMVSTMGFYPGGAEILPIRLANELKRRGHSVLLFSAGLHAREDLVRRMLRNDVPVVETSGVPDMRAAIQAFGIECLNSHQWYVQKYPVELPNVFHELRVHVASLHGMIEHGNVFAVTAHELETADRNVTTWAYTADKNLAPFKETHIYDQAPSRFLKIPNGMEPPSIVPVPRVELDIPTDAFVLCCVSRAIPDKGWAEAIAVVERARALSSLDIRLVLVGNGQVYDEYCRTGVPDFVYLAGFSDNSVGHYATSDMGIMLTTFKSESFPLTVVDCLFAGRPYLASDVGDIRNMLTTPHGVAGELVTLEDWAVPIESTARTVAELATRGERYRRACAQVAEAGRRFRIDTVADEYLRLFAESRRLPRLEEVAKRFRALPSSSRPPETGPAAVYESTGTGAPARA